MLAKKFRNFCEYVFIKTLFQTKINYKYARPLYDVKAAVKRHEDTRTLLLVYKKSPRFSTLFFNFFINRKSLKNIRMFYRRFKLPLRAKNIKITPRKIIKNKSRLKNLYRQPLRRSFAAFIAPYENCLPI